jgi:hypothetical protein
MEVPNVISPLARVVRSRRGRLAVSLGFAVVTTAVLVVVARSLIDSGWLLAGGNPALVAAAGLLFALAYGFKAYGWRRLFRKTERPGPLALAAAGGGASLMGVALPGRFDEMVRIAIVRRYPGCPVSVRGLGPAVAWRFGLHAWSLRPGRAALVAPAQAYSR